MDQNNTGAELLPEKRVAVAEMAEEREDTTKSLAEFLHLDTNSDQFRKWKEKTPDISEEEILLGCLYNRITREQSGWVKRGDLPAEVVKGVDEFLHISSEAVAELVVNKRVGQELRTIQQAREKLQTLVAENGVESKNDTFDVEPEVNILTFEDLILNERGRTFLGDPLFIVGLTTHGDIPAYVVSKLLLKKGVVSGVALIRPTSRDGREVVNVLDSDRLKLEEAKSYAKNILIVDDSIENGGSMRQALDFLGQEFTQPKTVCVAVSMEVPFLKKIDGEEYSTVTHEGIVVYNKAGFFKQVKAEE